MAKKAVKKKVGWPKGKPRKPKVGSYGAILLNPPPPPPPPPPMQDYNIQTPKTWQELTIEILNSNNDQGTKLAALKVFEITAEAQLIQTRKQG